MKSEFQPELVGYCKFNDCNAQLWMCEDWYPKQYKWYYGDPDCLHELEVSNENNDV